MQWSPQMINSISNKQDASNKEKYKKKNKNRILGTKRFIPGNGTKKVVA
jgi:hypothetical protein